MASLRFGHPNPNMHDFAYFAHTSKSLPFLVQLSTSWTADMSSCGLGLRTIQSVFSTVLGLPFSVFAEAAWDKCPKPYHQKLSWAEKAVVVWMQWSKVRQVGIALPKALNRTKSLQAQLFKHPCKASYNTKQPKKSISLSTTSKNLRVCSSAQQEFPPKKVVLLRANALASILQSFGQRELHNSTDGSEFLLEVSEGGNSSTALM